MLPKVERAVIISGSPGLTDTNARTTRKAKDDFRASMLISNGLKLFLDTWYAEELWTRYFNATITFSYSEIESEIWPPKSMTFCCHFFMMQLENSSTFQPDGQESFAA